MFARTAFWLVMIALLGSAMAHAHEIGTTRVAVIFQQDRTYNIEIVTDAVTLVEKLEVSSGSPSSAETRAPNLQSLLTGFDEKFRRRVKITFDGSEVNAAATYSVVPGSSPVSD